MRFTLVLLSMLIFHTAIAQKSNTINGTVTDSNTEETIPFSTVSIYNNENLVDGVSTDENGKFELRIKKTFTHLKVSFIGYETLELSFDEIEDSNDLKIKLKQITTELDEVVIQAERTTTELKIDRKVINLGADLQQSGTTILEAFSQITEIETDPSGESISLRGNGNVRILVNGKPSSLSATELLDQIPSSSVDRIEIITSPSSKHQADGLSGIINVILKKNSNKGLNLNLKPNVGFKRYGIGLGGNYNFSFVNFRFNASHSKRDIDRKQMIDRVFSDGSTPRIYTPSIFDGKVNTISSGLDFFIDKKNELSFELDYTDNTHAIYYNSLYSNLTDTNDYYHVHEFTHIHKTTVFNTNYRRKFAKEGHFIEFDYNLNKSNNESPGSQRKEDVLLFNNNNKYDNVLHAFAIDYTLPVTKNTLIETGASWNNRNLNTAYFYTPANGTLTTSFSKNQEDLLGIYGLAKFTLGKFSLQTGLRYEYFTSKYTTLASKIINQKFSNLFPSAHISYHINEENVLNIGYAKRISRPNLFDLSPFYLGNPYSKPEGNPNLEPEFSDSFEISYQKNTSKIDYSVTAFYRYIKNALQEVNIIENDILISSKENSGNNSSYGIEGTAKIKIAPYWNSSVAGNYYFTKVNQSSSSASWDELYGSSFQLKNTFKINSKISTDITYRHTLKTQSSYYYVQPRNKIDWAIRAKFLENKLTASFVFTDVMNTNILKFNSVIGDFTENVVQNFNPRGFIFSLNYKLFESKGRKIRNRKKRKYNTGNPG